MGNRVDSEVWVCQWPFNVGKRGVAVRAGEEVDGEWRERIGECRTGCGGGGRGDADEVHGRRGGGERGGGRDALHAGIT